MPTIEGKEAKLWIDAYVKKAGKFKSVAKEVRALLNNTAPGCEEYVSGWKVPSFDSNGPLGCFLVGKEHVTLAFIRGAALPDPEKLLEGKGKYVKNISLRSVADVKRPGVKKLIAEAAKLNKKDPPRGMLVGNEQETEIKVTQDKNAERKNLSALHFLPIGNPGKRDNLYWDRR